MNGSTLTRHDRLVLNRGVRRSTDPLTGEQVLLFPEGVLLLNETAARTIEYCDGVRTVGDVVLALSDAYVDVRARDVMALLDDLVDQHLMVRDG